MEPSRQPTFRRRQYLVDRSYQLRFAGRLFLIVLAVAVASGAGATGLLWVNISRSGGEQPFLIVTSLITVAVMLLLELLLAIPMVLVLGIRQSHRIVGPLKRLRRTLQAIGNGDFSQRIILREGDVLADVAKAINEMAERLQRRPPSSPPA
jgi:methyl-accepting chemotaxis protein